MKPIKRRIDIRLKKRLFEKIKAISEAQDKTWTDVIETALEYGLKWYEAKIKRELAAQEGKPVQTQENNTTMNILPKEEIERRMKELREKANRNEPITMEETQEYIQLRKQLDVYKNIEIAKYNWMENR